MDPQVMKVHLDLVGPRLHAMEMWLSAMEGALDALVQANAHRREL